MRADEEIHDHYGADVQDDEPEPMFSAQRQRDEGDEQQVSLRGDVNKAVLAQQRHTTERGYSGWPRQACGEQRGSRSAQVTTLVPALPVGCADGLGATGVKGGPKNDAQRESSSGRGWADVGRLV